MVNFTKILMMKNIIWIVILLLMSSQYSYAQDSTDISQQRKDNIIKLLNYRYKGGYYNFEKLFYKKVTYPEVARNNCIVGITILSITVECDGTVSDVRTKNSLGFGIDEAISMFMNETSGNWNTCTDPKYTKIEIPIQFRTDGTQTADDVALLTCIGENPGFVCNDDEYYLKKAERFLEKKKGKKAMEMLDILIKRNPYNTAYYEMKKKALDM